MTHRLATWLLLLSFIISRAAPAAAQRVAWDVIGSGGCIGSTSLLHRVSATIGQPAVGVTVGPAHHIHAGFWNPWLTGTVGVLDKDGLALPTEFALCQNYPNPFGSATIIQYAVPRASRVTVSLFNMSGQRVRLLADGLCQPGYYTVRWDGADSFGKSQSSGIYICRMIARSAVGPISEQSRELILVK